MSLTDSKLALRRVARRWLPTDILERPKQGFVLPMKAWLTAWFERRGGPGAYFRDVSIPELNTDEVASLAQRDLAAGVGRERLLYALVALAEWRAACVGRLAAARKLSAPAPEVSVA